MNKAILHCADDLQVDAEMHVHAAMSAVDGLKRIAAVSPQAVRSTAAYLRQVSDELADLVAKLEGKSNAV